MFMRAIAFVLAVIAGISASQVPEFAQQYRQRLGGSIDELTRVVGSFDKTAAAAGTDRNGGLAVMAGDSEALVRGHAVDMAESILRLARLTAQQQAFQSSEPFVRLSAFANNFDAPLMENTFDNFEPAVPVTVEGFVFAGVGFVFVYYLLRILGFLVRPRRRHRHAASNA